MTDLVKTVEWSFEAYGQCVNEPYAKAVLNDIMTRFVRECRNIPGGTVFPIPGSSPASGFGEAPFSGWTDSEFVFEDGEAPKPAPTETNPTT